MRKNIEIKRLKVIIARITRISRQDVRSCQAGLIVSELTMIDDNGSCSLIERPVLHVTGACMQRRAAFTSLRVCKFQEGSHVRTIMRERLLFQFHEVRRGNLEGNRAPNRGIFCLTSARYHLRENKVHFR